MHEPPLNPVLERLGSYPMSGFDELKRKLAAEGKPIYDFGIGDPVEETPSFIREALLAAVDRRSQYPTVVGQRTLREAAAGYVSRRFGVSVDPETELLPSAGSKEAIFHLPFALLDASSERNVVVMPDPGYPVYEHGTAFAGGVSHKVPLRAERRFLLEPDDVGDEVLARTAVFWISYPHNPTGAVADRSYFERVYAAAEKHGFVVASDECYVDLYFGAPPPSILQISKRGTLAFFSCSKRSGMTGYRTGFMAGDARIIAALRKMRPSIGTASPDFVQHAAAAAWSDDAHAVERRRVFAAKRERLLSFFETRGIEAGWSEGTFYVWARVSSGYTSESYAQALMSRGIVVSPGTFFGAGEGFVRIALVPSLDAIGEAISKWP
nr:succinyldiaminopimelate transaminase [uncultured bacterium]